MIEIRYYQNAEGERPFIEWLQALQDQQAGARVRIRLDRLALGNFGDCEPVGGGVTELRIHWGPGYRVYCARLGQVIVLLLCGGDKRTQKKDIKRAKDYLEDYKAREKKKPPSRSKPAI